MKTLLPAILALLIFSCADTKPDPNFKGYDELQAIAVNEDSLKQVQQRRDSLRTIALKDLEKFKKHTDDFEGVSFYEDPRSPKYVNINFIYPYIGERDGHYWLKLKFQYTSDNWLFIENVKIKTDANQYQLAGNFERDHDSRIWEWRSMTVENEQLPMLEDIATSDKVVVRYEGSQYHDDRTLTNKEKSIIKNTIDIYKGLQ